MCVLYCFYIGEKMMVYNKTVYFMLSIDFFQQSTIVCILGMSTTKYFGWNPFSCLIS